MEQLFFCIFAGAAVGSALAVVTLRNPVHSALCLMICFFQIAGLFILLRSPFLAVAQVFIYVGAVMVLFLFVVLLLDVRKVTMEAVPVRNRGVALAVIGVVTVELLVLILGSGFPSAHMGSAGMVTIEAIGRSLFTTYLFPFEVVSVVLLVAMVGAIVMTRERHD